METTTNTEVKIVVDPKTLPEGIIKNAVAVAIAQAMDDSTRENIITDVVRAHLNHKASTYDKETILSKAVGDAIRGMVREALSARLETIRPKVNDAVSRLIGPKFESQVFEQLESALSKVVVANISVSAKLYAEEE